MRWGSASFFFTSFKVSHAPNRVEHSTVIAVQDTLVFTDGRNRVDTCTLDHSCNTSRPWRTLDVQGGVPRVARKISSLYVLTLAEPPLGLPG